MSRLRAALDRRPAARIQAPRRRGRLGTSLFDHGLRRRGADRPRADEVRGQRHALPRLEAGDVVGGREDRARRGRGRIRGLHVRYGVGEVSGADGPGRAPGALHPWRLPGDRWISYSSKISYGLYEVVDAPMENWAKVGDRLVLADPLAID